MKEVDQKEAAMTNLMNILKLLNDAMSAIDTNEVALSIPLNDGRSVCIQIGRHFHDERNHADKTTMN